MPLCEEPIVVAKNLTCLSGSNYLLNDINWEIQRGDQWVVFGRNGCGKTTLLSIIAGYKNYSSGTLRVFHEEYSAQNILTLRKKIGWISSSFFDKYYFHESVLSIVLSGLFGTLGIDHGYIPDEDVIHALNLLDNLGIKRKHKLSFSMLSKGERQNVLIARAFISDPELLILDEPGTGLDVIARERLLNMLQDLSENKNMTTIYVTHYPEEILPSFDKCLLLRNGTIYQTGNTEALLQSNTMSEFLNTPIDVSYHNKKFNFSLNH